MTDPVQRLRRFQQKIIENKIDCAILFYSRDILYYTGTAQPSYLVIFPDDYFLFVKSGLNFALQEVFIDISRLREERKLENIFSSIFSKHTPGKIGTELDVMPASQYLHAKSIFNTWEFVDISPVILKQKSQKDMHEIELIRAACHAVDAGHKAVVNTLKEGMTELELAAEIEKAHRLAGNEGEYFFRVPDFFMNRGIVSSGENLFKFSGILYSVTGTGNSSAVPVGPSDKKIRRGDLVIVDVPTLIHGYHADQTRTYVLGKPIKEVEWMYLRLKEVSDHVIKNIRPEMKCSEIYKMAVDKSEKLDISDIFLNFGQGKKSFLIGHGVGTELNEPPVLASYNKSIVDVNYVLAIEMHIMKENVCVIKIEDTILIGEDQNEVLTITPRNLFVI